MLVFLKKHFLYALVKQDTADLVRFRHAGTCFNLVLTVTEVIFFFPPYFFQSKLN